jgi:anti-sigma factor RsiW
MSRMVRRGRPQADCESRDQELLLYVHGALPPMARLRTSRHLRGCPTCRQRAASFLTASGAFADSLRGDALPKWKPPVGSGWIPSTPAAPLAIVALLAVTFFSASIVLRTVQASAPPPASESIVPPEGFSSCRLKKLKAASAAMATPGTAVKPAATPIATPLAARTADKPPLGSLPPGANCQQCH